MSNLSPRHTSFVVVCLSFLLSACADGTGSAPTPAVTSPPPPSAMIGVMRCTGNVPSASLSCEPVSTPPPSAAQNNGPRADIHVLGGQGVYVRLSSYLTTYNAETRVLSSAVPMQNLSNQIFATDSLTAHEDGVRVFFAGEPTITQGFSAAPVAVLDYDGTAAYTAAGQKYYQYGGWVGSSQRFELGADGVLGTAELSGGKEWRFGVEPTVTSFTFSVYIVTHTPPGPIVTVAPQITGVSPATLVPGEPATITGFNFNATPDLNSVRIGGIGATVTGGGTNVLTVIVPCVASGTVPITVAKRPENAAGDPLVGATYMHPLEGACGS